jgi:hypothetical protein
MPSNVVVVAAVVLDTVPVVKVETAAVMKVVGAVETDELDVEVVVVISAYRHS